MDLIARAWVVIVLGGLATFALRASFLVAAHRFESLPSWASDAMRMVPAAALAGLVAPALLRPDASFAPLGPEALAGGIALVVALRTRSVLAPIVVGLIAVMGLEHLLG